MSWLCFPQRTTVHRALVIAEIEIPFHSAAQIGGIHILAKEEERWNLIRIAGGKAKACSG